MRLALLFLSLWTHPPVQTPVRVEATLSSSTLHVGASTTLTITVTTRGPAPESIEVPSLPSALQVLRTSEYTEFQFRLPGGRSRVLRREITLLARSAGEFTIPPVSVRVQGRRYQTRPLTVRITPGVTAGRTFGRGRGEDVILRASIMPETVYVGQQTTFRAEALFSADLEFRLRRSPEYEPPNPSGFWIHDLPDPPSMSTRVVADRVYAAQTFRRAFFPLAPGRYAIPPARLAYDVSGGSISARQNRELQSDSLPLLVLPLPEAGRPPSFTGAVGRFVVRARIEPAEVPAGEAALLTLEVQGQGNIKALPPPVLPELPGVEVYPPSEEAVVETASGSVQGVKRFTWMLVPRRSGRIEIPPIEYAYFDPERREYDVARALPLAITARAGREDSAESAPATLRDLKVEPAGARPLAWVRSPAFAALQLVPLLGLLWALRRQRRLGRRPASSRPRPLRRDRRAFAELASPAAQADPEFLARLGEAFRTGVAARLGKPDARKASPDALRQILEGDGASAELAQRAAELLRRIDHARFAPVPPTPDSRRALAHDAQRLLRSIHREVGRARRPRWARRLFASFLPVLVLHATAASTQDRRFQAAVEAYEAGDHEAASQAFLAFALAHPDDVHAWYDLGNAYFQAGARGRAVWAWLRAARLDPREPDTRANLAAAGVDAALLRRTLPRIPLSTEETLLAASLAWILGASALIIRMRRARRATALGAASALLLALALLASWARPWLGPDTAIVFDQATPLLAEPAPHAEKLRELDAATGLDVHGEQGAWLRVTTPDGAEGWVEASRVGRL